MEVERGGEHKRRGTHCFERCITANIVASAKIAPAEVAGKVSLSPVTLLLCGSNLRSDRRTSPNSYGDMSLQRAH